MTLRLNFDLTLAVLGSLAIGGVAATVNPASLGTAFAFGGGLIGGASIMREKARERQALKNMTDKVASTFSALYEINRGVVDPMQLAYLTNTSPDQAYSFLDGLAEHTGGQKIATKANNGVVFAFPHTASALEELSKNAENWAKSQTQGLAEELNKYKQAVQMLQLQQAARAATPPVAPEGAPRAEIDPWTRS